MEKLIDGLKLAIETPLANGEVSQSGLMMRYSPSYKLWIVGYGRKRTPQDEGTGTGHSLIEAIVDFKEKQAKL